MRAVLPDSRKTPSLGDLPDPAPGPGEVLLEVRATALNRVDLLQLRGRYPPPEGESEVPGLEAAGTIAALGEGVSGWKPGQRVMALLAGGGHAERVAVPAVQLMALPDGLSFEQGAAVPESGLTAWTNLVVEGELRAGERVLVTGANGGVGTFAVQVARELGATVLAAGRSRERLAPLEDHAHHLVLDGENLPEAVREATGGQGVDLVMDLVSGEAFGRHLDALAPQGRLVLVGVVAGAQAPVNLADLLRRRLTVKGSTLRSRPREEKAQLVRAFADFAVPRLADGRLTPLVDRVFPFEAIADAYRAMGEGSGVGKIVVRVG